MYIITSILFLGILIALIFAVQLSPIIFCFLYSHKLVVAQQLKPKKLVQSY